MAMKKILIAVFCIFAFASVCFAVTADPPTAGVRGTAEFSVSDLFIYNAYVYDSDDGAAAPTKIVQNDAVLIIKFWAPLTQDYYRHWLVTDPTGTFVYYLPFDNVRTAGIQTAFTVVNLPDGDYIFTGVVAGADSGIAVTDPWHFSVRP
jgi:hypothetical protein